MDKFLYEARPFFYAVLTIYAVGVSRNSFLMIISGALMGLCCLTVAIMRYDNRKGLGRINQLVQAKVKSNGPKIHHSGQEKFHIK